MITRIELPFFSGDIQDYWEFRGAFRALINADWTEGWAPTESTLQRRQDAENKATPREGTARPRGWWQACPGSYKEAAEEEEVRVRERVKPCPRRVPRIVIADSTGHNYAPVHLCGGLFSSSPLPGAHSNRRLTRPAPKQRGQPSKPGEARHSPQDRGGPRTTVGNEPPGGGG